MKKLSAIAGLALALVISAGANAGPILWTVDIELIGGGTVTGSYVYDVDTDTFSNVNVSAVPTPNPFDPDVSVLTGVLDDYSDSAVLDLVPDPHPTNGFTGLGSVYISLHDSMTNAGGVIDVYELTLYDCYNNVCDDYAYYVYWYDTDMVRGTVTSGSVEAPAPAALGFLGLGLAGLGIARRRRSV